MTAPQGVVLPQLNGQAPIDVAEVDLDDPEPPVGVTRPSLVLVRRAGVPCGVIFVPAGCDPETLLEQAHQVADCLSPDEVPVARKLADATVVVTTIHAGGQLAATLDDLACQSWQPSDVVVVDNRPRVSGVQRFLAERQDPLQVRYVAEHRPGLSRARNAGLAASTSPIVAFTDDDVRLDRDWLRQLCRGFADGVDCVTGLVMPLELRNQAQLLMEQFGGFTKGFEPRLYDLDRHRDDSPLYPFSFGIYGTGANAAFRREALHAVGAFDPLLGTGRATRGGEDLDIFLRLILEGRKIAYHPSALLWHSHEDELPEFRRRVFGYGVGLGAVIGKHLTPGRSAREIVRRSPAGLRHLLDPRSPKNLQKDLSYPIRYALLELAGIALGPPTYAALRLRLRLAPGYEQRRH